MPLDDETFAKGFGINAPRTNSCYHRRRLPILFISQRSGSDERTLPSRRKTPQLIRRGGVEDQLLAQLAETNIGLSGFLKIAPPLITKDLESTSGSLQHRLGVHALSPSVGCVKPL